MLSNFYSLTMILKRPDQFKWVAWNAETKLVRS